MKWGHTTQGTIMVSAEWKVVNFRFPGLLEIAFSESFLLKHQHCFEIIKVTLVNTLSFTSAESAK